jgi:multidrug resistance efflux pump
MSLWRHIAILALAAALVGCNEKRDPGYQGWVEADMIFVSPDESGRVTKLDVREGDEVKVGDHLYAVDDDLQQADLNQNKATLANAQQTYDRAAALSKTGAGTQATLDSAVSSLRVAEARVVSSQTRLAAGALDHAARQHEAALLCVRDRPAEICDRGRGAGHLRQLRRRPHRARLLHRDIGGIHAAGHLQPR